MQCMKLTPFSSVKPLAALTVAAGFLLFFADRIVAVDAQKSAVPAKADVRTVTHVLNRIGFGARPGDVERVQQIGLSAYIDQQLRPEKINDAFLNSRLAEFETLSMSSKDLSEKYFLPADELKKDQQLKAARADAKTAKATDQTMAGDATMAAQQPPKPNAVLTAEQRMIQQQQQDVVQELMQAKILRAAVSERQLNEVLTDFWFNHFNVYVQKQQVRQYLTEYERDVIRPNVLGSFRDLLGAVAHSPAMLYYLDNWQSSADNAEPAVNPQLAARLRGGRGGAITPAQRQQMLQRLEQQKKNQPKGLNENYGRELMELHTLGVDGGYTQKDVVEAARILTGWTIDQPRAGGSFVYRPQMHDRGEKTILGVTFKAGGGQDEGEKLLDMLASNPATARHISFKLAQRFVADEPPAALVDRAAKKFLETKGDLREVTRLIITSPEFFSEASYRAKVKTPFEFVVSAVRVTGTTVGVAQPLVAALRTLGMPLYGCQPPTGYSMTADAWVNTGALLARMNFAVQLVGGGRGMVDAAGRGRGPGGQAPPQRPLAGAQRGRGQGAGRNDPLQIDTMTLAPDTSQSTQDKLIATILAGDVSEATRQTLAKASGTQQLIALTLGSPEFQKR